MPAIRSRRKSRCSRKGPRSIRSARRRAPQPTAAIVTPRRRPRPRIGPTRDQLTRMRAPRRGTLVMLRTLGTSRTGGGHVVRREDLTQHGDALHQREPGPDAAPDTAAERDPGVHRRVVPDEPRRVEATRGRDGCRRAAWLTRIDGPTVAPAGRSQPARVAGRIRVPDHHRDHRVQPHRLLQHRLEVGVVAVAGGGAGRRASWSASRPSSCSAHASAVAVVSWPASSSVTSWSRSSSSVRPVALVVDQDQPGQHVRAARRGRGPRDARGSRRRSARRGGRRSRPCASTGRTAAAAGSPSRAARPG